MPEAVRVLCAVRDRRAVQRLIGEMDDGEHCVFDVVTTGAQALEACWRVKPDILVIDAVLPEIDGLGVVEQLHEMLGARMPSVIGYARTLFARDGFLRRGARVVVTVPWRTEILKNAILHEMQERAGHADWEALFSAQRQAEMLLLQMGMHASLKGFAYLCSAAALAYESESRLYAVGKRIYEPLAIHFHTTAQSVERLIRHAIESTMSDARARGVYSLFGNTIDPAKGKPTNAQAIAMLVQRMRVEIPEAEKRAQQR